MTTLKLYDSGIVMRTMAAVVFLTFTFLWIYHFQADVLAYAQHVFSDGQTHYNRLVGALLITAILQVVQLVVYAVLRLQARLHVLTYYPSLVLLALLDAICPSAGGQSSLSLWWLLLVPLTVVWLFAVKYASQMSRFDRKTSLQPVFSNFMWTNLLVLSLMMLGVTLTANTNAVFHYRARVETRLLQQRFADALQVGAKSLETDASLTMLRAYALARQGELGESLFQYPVAGSSADLLPLTGSQSRLLRYPQDSLFRQLGALPRKGMTTAVYLDRLLRYGQATPLVADYLLCGQLVDRDLDAFARTLPLYYEVPDTLHPEASTLPRHYREALTLYTHLRSHPVLEYHDAVSDEDYANLQELESQYRDPRERHIRVKENYQGSYWYYYEYARQ